MKKKAKKKAKKKKLSKFILFKDGLLCTILSLVVCFLLSLIFFNISFFNPVSKALQDFSFLDVYYSERLQDTEKVNSNIVLLNIEQKSRYEIALALEQLLNAKPKVIGLDLILQDVERSHADSLLAQQLSNNTIVSATVFAQEKIISNHPFFRTKKKRGFVNFNFDTTSAVIREFASEVFKFNKRHESFSKLIAKQYVSKKFWKKQQIEKTLKKVNTINYQYNLDNFVHLNIDDFMSLQNKQFVKDKIVLVGYLGVPTGNRFDIEDKHFTPLNKITSGKSIPDMYGLVVHANIIAMIISNNFMKNISVFWLCFLTFFLSFLASTYFIWLDNRLKLTYRTVRKMVLFIFTLVAVWVTLLLFKYGIVLKIAPIIAVVAFSAGFVKFYKHLARWLNTKIKFNSFYS